MSFLSLPNEIILQIAEDLLPTQLNSLSRVNRRLANLISHVLLESLFRTRSPDLGALALFNAAERNDWRVVKRLVDRGIFTFAGNGLLLNHAVEKTRSERVVATLLAYGVAADAWSPGGGRVRDTPLSIAVDLGCWDIARLLLGRKDVDPNGRGSGTPLIAAVKKNDISMARLLLSNPLTKIDPDTGLSPPSYGIRTSESVVGRNVPLQIALEKEYLEMVLLLLVDERIDVNTPFNTGWSPLHLAASKGNETIVRVLLSDPNIRVSAQNYRGWTPLHQAVDENFVAIARILLSDERSDVNAGPPYHRTALHIAVQNKNLTLVQLLLNDERTKVNLGPPYYHPTPLHLAAQLGALDILNRLLRDPRIDVNVVDDLGQTPLHLAAATPNGNALEYLLRDGRVDVNVINSYGETPLDVAKKKGREKAALALISRRDLVAEMKKKEGVSSLSLIDSMVGSKEAVFVPSQGIGEITKSKVETTAQKGFGRRLKDVVTGLTMRRR